MIFFIYCLGTDYLKYPGRWKQKAVERPAFANLFLLSKHLPKK
jgi:hypothetical protein